MKRWLTLFLIVLAAFALVAVPVWLIKPFSPQTPRALEVGYTLRRWSPWLTIVLLVASFVLVGWLWRDSRRWWKRTALLLLLLPMLASAWFARQNHFEWMFKPLPATAYARVNEAGFIGDEDMVLAVERNGDATAYPVRLMAYHHLVHDTVGGTHVVATY